jgi:hypothetical protein
MPSGTKNKVKNSNVNYLARDFNDLKQSLIRHTKTYFPNTYKDFNETSPGMMLIEMSAYVGDVLNFYVDQQYREMLLPLSEEKRNIVTLAKSHGYKVKPISPAYVNLSVKQTVGVHSNGDPDYSTALTIDKSMQTVCIDDPTVIFETLDIVDFKISSSADLNPEVTDIGSDGIPTEYTLTRKVKSISGETKTTIFNVGEPQKFLKLSLAETNVIEILSVVDFNNNPWSEVQNLAQDKIPVSRHYTSDENRANAYTNKDGSSISMPVPFSLLYNKVHKKFVVDVDENNNTSLVFGNGILKNGRNFNSTFLAIEQKGIDLPGGEENMESEIDPLLGDSYGTLGEAPAHTKLTVTYRVGGGISSNVSTGKLTIIDSIKTIPADQSTSTISTTNDTPADGGSTGESIEEIRHRAIGHISTQDRVVTKEDYEARTLNLPARYGNIAKVHVTRAGSVRNSERQRLQDLVGTLKEVIDLNYTMFDSGIDAAVKVGILQDIKRKLDADKDGGLTAADFDILYEVLELAMGNVTQDDRLATIDLYLLSFDKNKNLVNTGHIIKQNLKQYLSQYRLLTDQVTFYNGYIINFGVVFDVVSVPYENKDVTKLQCIDAIKEYFNIDNMSFKQIMYTSELENLLMDLPSVRAVNYVTITQRDDYNSESKGSTSVFPKGLYTTLVSSDGATTTSRDDVTDYGYYYDFSVFYGPAAIAGRGIILPSYEPSIFELKNPNQNIRGIVR